MDNFDHRVTLCARHGDIATCDGGSRIGMRKNRVWSVAGGTVRSYNETLLKQALTVDALGEVLENMVLMNRVLSSDWRPLFMALTAKEWNLHWKRRRLSILR